MSVATVTVKLRFFSQGGKVHGCPAPLLHILALLLMPRGLEGSQGLTLRELLFCGTSKGQGPGSSKPQQPSQRQGKR